ncbi:MAG: hypothetical protein NPIRA04_08870 [Nitrospirales bacterium]|nr:MAG: hypothetical protein NPIRA04_08870 [Nitrospirales bacterium]
MDEGKIKRDVQEYEQQVSRAGVMGRKLTVTKLSLGVLGFMLVCTCGMAVSGSALLGFPYYSWHQKMTIEVNVGGQLYASSSVVAMSGRRLPELLPEGRVRDLDMRGEAVVVDLPKNQYLFALLTYDAYLTGKVFHDLVGGVVSQPEEWASEIDDVQEIREIHPKDYPLLVTFTDINDPKTVKEVDPDNLEAMFGPGVSLKRITLEITDEDVTEGKVEQVLGWWCALRKKQARLNGSTSVAIMDNELSNNLGTGSFRIGDCT